MNFWDNDEIELLKAFCDATWSYDDIANELDRTNKSVRIKTQRLKISNGNNINGKLYTNKEFLILLRKNSPKILALEIYRGMAVPIEFKCLDCGAITTSMPKSKIQGHKCIMCGYNNNGGDIPLDKQGIIYLVYIPKFDLYKIGITSKTVKERMRDNKISDYVLILEHKFSKGINAINLEKQWKENLKDYLVNTGLLKTGNTETFRL